MKTRRIILALVFAPHDAESVRWRTDDAEGIRFVENTEAKIWYQGGASSGDVYATNFIGQGAYATTELEGGGLEMIVKQNGSAGSEDPLNQRSTIGWKATTVAKILIPEYLVRVESSATNAATAIIT